MVGARGGGVGSSICYEASSDSSMNSILRSSSSMLGEEGGRSLRVGGEIRSFWIWGEGEGDKGCSSGSGKFGRK